MLADVPVERSKRPRDDSNPWNVAWPSDTHRRVEVLWRQQGCDQLDEWCLESQGRRARYSCPWCGGSICAVVPVGGTFRPRTDENDWCRHIFRESDNKAADTHASWLMDNGDSGPGAQWMAPDLHDNNAKITSY